MSNPDKRRQTMIDSGYGVNVKKYPEYIPWANMHKRRYDTNHPAYKNYGGRGITVCDRWNSQQNKRGVGLLNFLEDMGPRPSPNLTLERIRSADGYTPENCCWATYTEQNNNRRNVVKVYWDGKDLTYAQWEQETGIPRETLWKRLTTGWSVEGALTTPVKRGNKKC